MGLVERLTVKWDDAFAGQEYPEDDPERHEVAKADTRWWLNAIADELVKDGRHGFYYAIDHLRAQANERD